MSCGKMAAWRNAIEVYEYLCGPVCREANIQQGELTVLLFLDGNPDKNTGGDIHKYGGIKQSMVSVLVEKLVQGGYLERQPVPGDRRKVRLVCTGRALPVIAAGRAAQKKMLAYMTAGVSQEDVAAIDRVLATVEQNIMRCREQMLKGELK